MIYSYNYQPWRLWGVLTGAYPINGLEQRLRAITHTFDTIGDITSRLGVLATIFDMYLSVLY